MKCGVKGGLNRVEAERGGRTAEVKRGGLDRDQILPEWDSSAEVPS